MQSNEELPEPAYRPRSEHVARTQEHDARSAAAGSPPCLTEPANSNCTILRHGVDSLYLSYKGQLHEPIDQALRALKECAQSPDEITAASAQLHLGDHLFAVSDRGRRKFAYVLDDNWYSVALASFGTRALPMAHAQISSELITAQGVQAASDQLTAIVSKLGTIISGPSVSRVDLFVDFIAQFDFEAVPKRAWIKRAKKRAVYDDNDTFTGLAIGLGGSIGERIYDKTDEVERISHKDYLKPLWQQSGWTPGQTVWRLEFQLKRDAMPEQCFASIENMIASVPMMWHYLTTEWLRLAIENPNDDTRSRWSTHPLWETLSKLDHPASIPTLNRVRKVRIPSDQTLFKNGLWGLTSFMAREGITDFGEGLANYLHQAERFHRTSEQIQDTVQFEHYVLRKVLAKGRRFNTINVSSQEK